MFEYITSIFWGVIIGFAVAVPIGPVGIICIQKTITRSRLSGLLPGFGAAIADALLASVAAFSITVIFSFITDQQFLLRIVSSLFLLILGIFGLIRKESKEEIKKETAISLIDEFFSGFFLTITNPLTAFFFFMSFATISSKIGNGVHIATTFVIGIFIGSCLWWLLLTFVADRIAHKISHEHIKKMNKWFAIILIIVGLFMLISVLFKYF